MQFTNKETIDMKKIIELLLKFFGIGKEPKVVTPPSVAIDDLVAETDPKEDICRDEDFEEFRWEGDSLVVEENPCTEAAKKGKVWSVKLGKFITSEEELPTPENKAYTDIPVEVEEEKEDLLVERFELKKNTRGDFYFNLLAKNHKIILTSEAYKTKQSAIKGIASVKVNSERLKAFDMRTSKNNKDYFVIKAKNNKIIGVSEMYESHQMMSKGIASVRTNAPKAPIYESTFDSYKKITI